MLWCSCCCCCHVEDSSLTTETHRAQRCLPKHDQDSLERYAKLTHREASLILAGSGSCVRPLGALDHGRAMEAKPEGSPRRVGHGIASPKGAAKKEVHTSHPQVAGRHSNTVNREAPPTRSSHIRSSEPQWNRTQGQLNSCLWCQTAESSDGKRRASLDTTFRLSTKPNTNHRGFLIFRLLLWRVSVCVDCRAVSHGSE